MDLDARIELLHVFGHLVGLELFIKLFMQVRNEFWLFSV